MRPIYCLSLLVMGCGPPIYHCACPNSPAALLLHVNDAATNLPVSDPSFSEDGAPLDASCTDSPPADGGVGCTTWRIQMSGHHVVTVAAPNHSSQMLTVDLAAGSGGCCSTGQQLEKTVALTSP